ncbi:MAG: YtxH domain-containing protein [Bacilli bacterium]|nr:YtxH domain-containing protein [Bacilli bacterium]
MMKMSKKKTLGTLLAGVAIGTGLGILFAPKKGSETRRELKEKMDELVNKAKQIDAKEVKENIENKIEEIKSELKDLDKEKVLKIAKKKAKDIQNKAEDLVNYAVEKGTPVLENAANAVREKAIDVTKEVLNKLEGEK